MKRLHIYAVALLGGLLALTLTAQSTRASREGPTVVVGTFDSRAVAVAYARSHTFADELSARQGELEQARTAGDDEAVARLEALGRSTQERLHRQGFGAAPVDDILLRIEGELAPLAQAAGVDVIVSKWALAYRSPSAQFVDVTDALTAAFDPDEATLKTIRELLRTDPVPLDQLSAHD